LEKEEMMKRRIFLVLSFVMLCATVMLVNSCTKDAGPVYIAPEGVIDTSAVYSVSFSEDILPIFAENCWVCHPPFIELDLSAANAYTSLVNVESTLYPGMLVTPFEPDNSILWHKMTDTQLYGPPMPPPGTLDSSLIALIETWIEEGAVNN
jgi:hypothetical protein